MDGALTDDELRTMNPIELQREARARGLDIIPGNREQKLAVLLADNATRRDE